MFLIYNLLNQGSVSYSIGLINIFILLYNKNIKINLQSIQFINSC
jgi:hypothetical protein